MSENTPEYDVFGFDPSRVEEIAAWEGKFNVSAGAYSRPEEESLHVALRSTLAEIDRLREESARAYSQGVEDMRSAAAEWLDDHSDTWEAEQVRSLPPAGPSGDTPAPRDGDLTRTLRDAMKRYGVPAVMAEVGRLAQQHL